MKKKIAIIILILILLTLTLTLVNISTYKAYHKNYFYMDTYIDIKLNTTKNRKEMNKIFEDIDYLYKSYHELTDRYNSYNNVINIYYLNEKLPDNEEVEIDPRLSDIINLGIEYYDKTNGLLNIAAGNLTEVWKEFINTCEKLPSNEELNKKTKLAEEIIALQLTKIEEYKTAIEELENTLHSIEDNKEHIINDFAVIKDVMQIIVSQKTKQAILPHPTFQKTNNNAPTDFGETIESLNDESEEIKLPQTFKTRLEFYLTKNNRKTEIAKKIGQYMVHYKAILVPDNRIIHSIIKATSRCKYSIQYVTHE